MAQGLPRYEEVPTPSVCAGLLRPEALFSSCLLSSALMSLLDDLPALCRDEGGARRLAERLVLAVQAALLLRHAPGNVAQAFVASRILREPGGAFGRLPASADCAAILARALAT